MNTSSFISSKNNVTNAFAALSLFAALLVAPAVSAQTITAKNNGSLIKTSTSGFQAFIHPVASSLQMSVHFANPQEEKVILTILDDQANVVYRRSIGNPSIFHGRFDVSILQDGEYTMVVKSRKNTYSRAISIHTEQSRLALAQ